MSRAVAFCYCNAGATSLLELYSTASKYVVSSSKNAHILRFLLRVLWMVSYPTRNNRRSVLVCNFLDALYTLGVRWRHTSIEIRCTHDIAWHPQFFLWNEGYLCSANRCLRGTAIQTPWSFSMPNNCLTCMNDCIELSPVSILVPSALNQAVKGYIDVLAWSRCLSFASPFSVNSLCQTFTENPARGPLSRRRTK